MAYMITHFWPGGTDAQYQATVKVVHPATGLPAGQTYHAAGPTEGGYLIAAVWDSKSSFEKFAQETLMPSRPKVSGGFTGAPVDRACEVANLIKA